MRHGDDGCDYLHYELYPGPERDDIVDGAAGCDEHSAEQDALHLAADTYEEDDAEYEAEEDGEPAHPGDGVVVDSSGILRHVDGADLLGEGLDDGRGGEADGETDGYGQEHAKPQLCVEEHNSHS